MRKRNSKKRQTRKSGNRCGHDPKNPVLKPKHRKAPDNSPFILRTAEKLLETFYENPNLLLALRIGRHSPIQPHHNPHKTEPTTNRAIRSERREAIQRVLSLLLSMVDLASLRVGFYDSASGAFILPDTYWMAEQLGMGYQRLIRVLRALQDAGFLETTERSEMLADDRGCVAYRGRTAVRRLTSELFYALGISKKELERERQRASERQKKKREKEGKIRFGKYLSLFGKRPYRKKRIIEIRGEQIRWPNEEDIEFRRRVVDITNNSPHLWNLPPEERQKIVKRQAAEELLGFKVRKAK